MKIVKETINEIKRGNPSDSLESLKIGARSIIEEWCSKNLSGKFTIDDNLLVSAESVNVELLRPPDYLNFGTVCEFYCSNLKLSKDELLGILPKKVLNKIICWGNSAVTLDDIKGVCEIKKYTQVYTIAGKKDVNKRSREKDDVISAVKYNLDETVKEIGYVPHFLTYVALKFISSKGTAGASSKDVIKLAQKMVFPNDEFHPLGYWSSAFRKDYNGPMVKFTSKVGVGTYIVNEQGRTFLKTHSDKFEDKIK